jgi:trigger factor
MKTESRLENGYKKIIEFEVDKAELDGYRKASYEKIRKTAKVDGFRPGMAPESILRARYGSSIEVEAMNDAINSSYKNFIIENKIYPLSEPVIDNVDKKDEILKFTATLETFPEFDLRSYTGLTIEHEKAVVSAEDINAAVNEILEKHSSSKETEEAVADGHVVDVAIRPANMPDAKWENQAVEIGKNPNDTVDKELIGMKKGEIKTVSLNPTGQKDQSFELDIRIEKIGKKILPELNDEFAKTYDSKFATVDDLKNDLAENIEKSKLSAQELEVYEKFAKKITDAHDNFEVPPSILNKYLEDMVANAQKQYGKNIDKNMLRDLYKQNAEVALKWEYIRHKIMEAEILSVSDDDVDNKITQLAEERAIDIDKIRKYYSSKDKQQMLKEDLQDKKLREFLKEKNTVNFVEPSPASKTESE